MADDKKLFPEDTDGVFENIANYLKLVYRLLSDHRVSLSLKGIPFLSLIYLISPFDIPFPVDDVAVIWGLTYLFIELCPPDVVAQHREAISNEIFGRWSDDDAPKVDEEDVVDADYSD